MKNPIIIFFISTLILLALILWMLHMPTAANIQEILMTGGVLLLVGFATFIGISRLRSAMRKEPLEDELSKTVMTKAASFAYYISIYLWLVIMYFSDRISLESHSLIGAGIMGMALIFFFSWIGVKLFGMKHA
jgi:hypothetical protein